MVSEEIIKDAKSAPQTTVYKLGNGLATLDDQEEALKDPYTALLFALDVEGADIEKCQEAVCSSPYCAYVFARNVKEADMDIYQEALCKDRLVFDG